MQRTLAFVSLLLGCFALAPQAAKALPAEFSGDLNAFYTMPTTTPSGAHGSVVRWQHIDELSPGLVFNSDGVAGFRMMYVSTAADGVTKKYVTGSLLVPARFYDGYIAFPQQARPIVGFAAGTMGFADNCATSFGIVNSSDYDIILMRQALDKGWAIAVSDYQGLGTKRADGGLDDHTYVVGQILGRNVIDSVRASFEFDAVANTAVKNIDYPLRVGVSAMLRSSSRVAFWGYSEGGGSAAWAAQLAPSYDSGLNVRAVAAGGLPADLLVAGNAINNRTSLQNIAFGVLVAATIGYKQAYPELPLEQNFTNEGKALLSQIRGQCIVENVFKNFGFHLYTDYTVNGFNPLTNAQWIARINQNKLGLLPPTVPAFLYHSETDEALIFSQGRQAARDWCARGVRVTWRKYTGEHITGFVAGMGEALDFIEARFSNQTPANTPCSQIN